MKKLETLEDPSSNIGSLKLQKTWMVMLCFIFLPGCGDWNKKEQKQDQLTAVIERKLQFDYFNLVILNTYFFCKNS